MEVIKISNYISYIERISKIAEINLMSKVTEIDSILKKKYKLINAKINQKDIPILAKDSLHNKKI